MEQDTTPQDDVDTEPETEEEDQENVEHEIVKVPNKRGRKPKGLLPDFGYIEQYSLSRKLIAQYPSLKDAAFISGLTYQNIYSSMIGHSRTAGGFIWKYQHLDFTEGQKKLSEPVTPYQAKQYKIRSRTIKIRSSRTGIPIPVSLFDLNGKLCAQFSSVRKAALEYGISHADITKSCEKGIVTPVGYFKKDLAR